MPSVSHNQACADCGLVSSTVSKSRNRYLCHECFTKFVLLKVRKRMESYRFKNQVGDYRPKLLVPVSGGPSSLMLLHALDVQLRQQDELRNRRAYDLVLVHIASAEHEAQIEAWRASVQATFSDYDFLPLLELSDVFQYDSAIEENLRSFGLVRNTGEDNNSLLSRLFNSTKTPSARADLQELLTQRLIVGTAKDQGCEGVLWGHSDSRLAAKALADVAKGRGGSTSTTMADGMSSWGINFNFPLRDLYKVELDLYLHYQIQSLPKLTFDESTESTLPVSIRNTSIDSLLSNYITSQGEKYPSIMANVVRTSGKLQVLPSTAGRPCNLCSMPVSTVDSATADLCYGCNRMRQDMKI